MFHIEQIFNVLAFLLAVPLIFTIPGLTLLNQSRINLTASEKLTLSTVVGFVFFTVLSYFFYFLHLELFSLILTVGVSIYYLTTHRFNLILPNRLDLKRLFLILLIFIPGIVLQLSIISPSGTIQNGDLVFWSSHGHDATWHISLINELKRGYPFQNPVFAGEKLINYHFFSDIPSAQFSKYLFLNDLELYFRLFPFLFSILFGGICFVLGKQLGGSFISGLLTTIIGYCAGSFGYIVTFLQNRRFSGEILFGSSQIQSSIGNPPQIIASIIVLAIISLFYLSLKQSPKLNKFIILIQVLLIASLAGFKIYASIVILLSLGIVSLLRLLLVKKIDLMITTLLSGLASAIIFLPNSSGSTAFLIFQPWWYIRTMIASPDRLNWVDLELRRQTFAYYHNWKWVAFIEITSLLIFIIGNLGIRIIGLFGLTLDLKRLLKDPIAQLSFIISIISISLPLLFLQKGIASNSIQFLQYALLITGIFTGTTLALLIKRVKYLFPQIIIILLVVIVAIPTQVSLTRDFYSKPPLAKITRAELQALSFINNEFKTPITILTPPSPTPPITQQSTPPIWDWFDTAYVAAFSNQRTFYSDQEQVGIMGYNPTHRQQFQSSFFNKTTPPNNLKEVDIDLIYYPKPLSPKFDLSKTDLVKIYENSEVEIWRLKN